MVGKTHTLSVTPLILLLSDPFHQCLKGIAAFIVISEITVLFLPMLLYCSAVLCVCHLRVANSFLPLGH